MTFDDVSEEEKKKYESPSPDIYEGYKPKKTWVNFWSWFELGRHFSQIHQLISNGILDQIEHYNSKFARFLIDFFKHQT